MLHRTKGVFSGAGSFDPDGSISSYSWEFGDGGVATGVTTSHTYNTAGNYNALLRVTDNLGSTSSATKTITVNVPWTLIATIGGTSHTDTAPNGNISYRVQAFNAAAVSPYSNSVSFRIR